MINGVGIALFQQALLSNPVCGLTVGNFVYRGAAFTDIISGLQCLAQRLGEWPLLLKLVNATLLLDNLQIGLPKLCFLLSGLGYMLLREEQKQANPRKRF